MKFYPYKKRGFEVGKVLAMLKMEHRKIFGSFNTGA